MLCNCDGQPVPFESINPVHVLVFRACLFLLNFNWWLWSMFTLFSFISVSAVDVKLKLLLLFDLKQFLLPQHVMKDLLVKAEIFVSSACVKLCVTLSSFKEFLKIGIKYSIWHLLLTILRYFRRGNKNWGHQVLIEGWNWWKP